MKITFIAFLIMLSLPALAGNYKILLFDEPIMGFKVVCKSASHEIQQNGKKVKSSRLAESRAVNVELAPHTQTLIKFSTLGEECSKIAIEAPSGEVKVYHNPTLSFLIHLHP